METANKRELAFYRGNNVGVPADHVQVDLAVLNRASVQSVRPAVMAPPMPLRPAPTAYAASATAPAAVQTFASAGQIDASPTPATKAAPKAAAAPVAPAVAGWGALK